MVTHTKYQDGSECWLWCGALHREDGPAIIRKDGYRAWYQYGKLHRLDGPAIEWGDGSNEWYIKGQRHRDGAPAVEWPCGSKEWWVDNKRHRLDGPAIISVEFDRCYWYIDNEFIYTARRFQQVTGCSDEELTRQALKYGEIG